MHARYYTFHPGRFLSTDPVAGDPSAPQTWNLYGYALGNPVKYSDPRGMDVAHILYYDCYLYGYCSNDFITVMGQAEPPPPYNPVAGLGSLLAGRFLLSSLAEGGPGQGFPGQRLPELFKSMAAQMCPQMAQGVSIDNPSTSGGGGAYGLNLEYLPGRGLGRYRFYTPNNVASLGFDVGASLTVNGAIGSGPWSGDFIGTMGTAGTATFGGFGTPAELTGKYLGWHGLQAGGSFGIPLGVGIATTNYTKVVNLSFLIPWCK